MLGFMLLRIFALQLLLIVPALAQYVETSADGKTVTVTLPLLFEGKNKPMPQQLAAGDIQIFEGGVQRSVNSVEQRKVNDRLLVAVLLDTSNSQRSQFDAAKRAAQLVISKLVRENIDAAAVGLFAITLTHTNFMIDRRKAVAAFANAIPGSGTSVHDAIYEFTRKLTDPAIQKSNVVLFLLSDGDDNQSKHTLDEAIHQAQQSNVTICAIDTGLRPMGATPEKGPIELNKMVRETGGLLFSGYSENDLSKWLDQLAPALQNRNYATYETAADGAGKKIEVRSSLKKVKVVAPTRRESPGTSR